MNSSLNLPHKPLKQPSSTFRGNHNTSQKGVFMSQTPHFRGFFRIVTMVLMLAATSFAAKSGIVREHSTQRPLEGAQVMVQPLNLKLITDKDGRFVLPETDQSTVQLTVSALGYVEENLAVKPADETPLVVFLKSSVQDLGATRIKHQLQGQARALNKQKNSDNLKNVISADQIGRFPDQNAAEALQRAPGVSIARDQGEGRYVLIRGTEPRLSSVKINGQEIPSPEGDIRTVALDVIPSDQLSALEVNKALTPEMDGDAIGGQIDLQMKRAATKEAAFEVSAAGGYNAELESAENFDGTLNYGQRFGKDGALGVAAGLSFSHRSVGSDNNEPVYGKLDVLDTIKEWDEDEEDSVWVAADADGDGEDDELEAYEEMDLRDYEVIRERTSLNVNMDYRLGPGSELWLMGTFNRFSDFEHRRRLTVDWTKGELFVNELDMVKDAEYARELKDRDESQDIMMVSGGGKHLLGESILDYSMSWSYAQEEEAGRQDIAFVGDFDTEAVTKMQNYPPLNNPDGVDRNDASEYEFDEAVRADNLSKDQNYSGQINFEMPVSSSMDWVVKSGAKFRLKNKERDNKATEYGWDSDDDAPTLDEISAGDIDSDFLLGEYSGVGPSPDPDKHKDFINDYSSDMEIEINLEDSELGDYNADEQVYAGYLQSRLELGKWMFLAGARYEHTLLEYEGKVLDDDEGTIADTSADDSYGHLLPSVQARFRLTDNTNIRASYFRSVARPDFYDLVPYRLVIPSDDEIEAGNPDLKPTTADNFDLMAAHYFQSVGVLSAGYYYKWMENLIYPAVREEGDWEISQKRNGSFGQIHGMELAWNQQFTFLPGALSGFGFFSNYTMAWSEASIPGRDGLMDLPGQTPHTANLALSFERWGFQARLAWHFNGAYVEEVGEDADEDIYYDDHSRIDLSMSQELIKGMFLFTEFSNLTNQPLRYYQGEENNPVQQEYYGMHVMAGLKYAF